MKSIEVYNPMLLASWLRGMEADYWHLCQHVQLWDVSCERQVQPQGPDARKLVQLMTPRDLSGAKDAQCFFVPLVDNVLKKRILRSFVLSAGGRVKRKVAYTIHDQQESGIRVVGNLYEYGTTFVFVVGK